MTLDTNIIKGKVCECMFFTSSCLNGWSEFNKMCGMELADTMDLTHRLSFTEGKSAGHS